MRKLLFQLHKWIGLAIAIVVIPFALSGSALVWGDWLDARINPGRYAVSGGPAALDPSAYVDAARRVLGEEDRIAAIRYTDNNGPVVVAAVPKPKGKGSGEGGGAGQRSGPLVRTLVWLDPATAKVLDKAPSNAGVMRFFHVLHGSLLMPGIGRTIVGWVGVGMLILSLSGLWLWWPTIGRWTRGLRWKRHRNFDSNLHHQAGFWIALPLAVLSFTGVWISFPQVFASIGGGSQRAEGRPANRNAPPLAAPEQSVDVVVASARGVSPTTLTSITWPTEATSKWRISFGDQQVTVDDESGDAKAAKQGGGGNDFARTMRRVHDGDGMGPVWQTIIFIGGILPAVLAITGVIMWWRARGWRADLARRQAARVEQVPQPS